ncbi:MAG: hypothetical protein NC205_04835 [Prevotella sp.]|nr:hypothetical protein [Prevotella sp.]MCM1473867.1 hypothetical protein [Muribaculaceae bacterium]
MEYTFECCNLCRKSERCRKNFSKMVKCQQKFNSIWKESEEFYDFYEDNFDSDICYNENFNEYRCKSCDNYDRCFYNYCASEAEWQAQQDFIEKTSAGAYTKEFSSITEIISNGDLPF